MAFLDRIFRNRGLKENLSRDPVVRIEPIAPPIRPPRPPFPIPQAPVLPVKPLPIEEPRLPFERPPLRSPRDDFFSVQRLDNIPEIETIIPPVIPPRLPRIKSGPDPEPIKIPNLIGFDKPPSIGGAGGTDFEDKRSLGKERSSLGPPRRPPVAGGASLLQRNKPIPLEDFGFGRGVRPSELRDKLGNIVVGSAGVTPPEFAEYRKSPIQESFADFLARTGTGTTTPTTSPVVPPVITESVITPDPIIEPVVTPDPIIEPAPTTPAAVASDVGAVPVTTIPQDVRGQVDPVLAQQDTQEILTDPLLRSLYFGTADQPGFINQLQQATANLIGSDVPLQQTAGLSELEQIAQDRALADLGVAEPFVGERADLIRGSTRQFDPSMTQQFFNPFEDQVVQQTIQDVLEAGEKRDIDQRARDIQKGGLSAFGSRARLSAAERQRALGRGLTEALGGIRQTGFDQAQRDALSTFAQQRQAEQTAATGLGQVGTQLADLRAADRSSLVGFGQTGRDIEETGLSRLFQQQLDQQGRPLQALQLTGQLLPQFQAGQTRIDSQYRLPADPTALGLGAAFNAYAANKPAGT